jgi:hypothetical protein
MTEDLSDISADGIWNMVVYPVLQQDGNVISIDTISANSQTFKSRGLTLGWRQQEKLEEDIEDNEDRDQDQDQENDSSSRGLDSSSSAKWQPVF